MARDKGGLSDRDFMHYSRQILLPEVGEVGQMSLISSHVLVIGIGGLGNLVCQYLAAAGIGRLTLIDDDKVELSNLPRQLLFNEQDIGQFKSVVATDKLLLRNKACKVVAVTDKFSLDNDSTLLEGITLVLDCTDDFSTRHLINQSCIEAEVPLISASVAHFSGQLLMVDLLRAPKSGCYACLFPAQMIAQQHCRNVGVLGPMVGVMASMQALMATNVLLGIGQPWGKLLRLDGKSLSWKEALLSRDSRCLVCHAHVKRQVPLDNHIMCANKDTSYEPS